MAKKKTDEELEEERKRREAEGIARREAIPESKAASVQIERRYTKEGVKEIPSFEGPYGRIELPAGTKTPKEFGIPTGEKVFDVGEKSISTYEGMKQVSPADYYGSILGNIEGMTIGQKNEWIINSIVNSPRNTGFGEVMKMAARGQIELPQENLPELQQQASQIGQMQITPEQIQAMTPEQQQQFLQNADAQGIDLSQALLSGTRTALPSAIGAGVAGAVLGGKVGAAFGTAVTPGVGTAIGVGLGALGGFLAGVISNMQSQAAGKISAGAINVRKAEMNLRTLITDTNQNPANATRNIQLFSNQLARVDSAYGELYLDTRTNLNKFLGKDGTPELERFEVFNSSGGAREILISQMQQAVLNPDPNKVLVTMSDLEEE